MVKVVAGFEVLFVRGAAVEQARIEQTVGSVEHPHREEHGDDGGYGQVDVVGGGDEPDPE
jgi:hypothetical protein